MVINLFLCDAAGGSRLLQPLELPAVVVLSQRAPLAAAVKLKDLDLHVQLQQVDS